MNLILIITLSVLSGVVYILYKRALPKPIPGIPYNVESSQRLTGDIPHVLANLKAGKRLRSFWQDLARRHEAPLVQFFMPFSKPSVVVWDVREARDLLVRRSKSLDRGPMNNDMWWGAIPHHFIAMDTRDPRFGEAKALQKDLMTPAFLHRVSAPASYGMVLHLIELWGEKAERARGGCFDAIDDLNYFTADTVFAAALGIEDSQSNTKSNLKSLLKSDVDEALSLDENSVAQFPKSEPNGLLHSILVLGEAIGKAPTFPSQKLYWILANLQPKIRKAKQIRHRILQEHINLARLRLQSQNGKEPHLHASVDYMVSRELAAAKEAGRRPCVDSPPFHDLLFGYCLGGQDTTHSVLSFLVKQLGIHQTTQTELRKALRETHHVAFNQRRAPTQEEITKSQVPLLDAVLYEVMRCDSPSPFITKQTLTDMTILGTVVPKGTQLFFPLFGPSLDAPALPIPESLRNDTSQQKSGTMPSDWVGSGYPPHEFHAERWLTVNEKGEMAFDPLAGPFMTFGAGIRECWGRRLALLQLRLVTTLLVWNFEFLRLPEGLGDDMEAIDVLNAKPKTCFVRLRKIEV